MTLHIKLLGRLHIEEETGTAAPLLKSQKGCALLTYLIVTGQPQRRELLADLLWDAPSTSQSLRNLRTLLARTRRLITGLTLTRQQVAYAAETAVFIDYLTLDHALNHGSLAAIDEALALYQGELLAGFYLEDAPRFNEWLLLEREQLRQRVTAAYHQLCFAYSEQGAWAKGIAAAQRWLALDEFDEDALRQLLQFLAASGQVGVALEQYETSRQRLWDEMEVEPTAETVRLAQRLQALRAQTGSGLAWSAIVGAQLERPSADQLAEPGALPPHAVIPYQRNNDFTGRQHSLLRLASLLLSQKAMSKARAVAVTGMGGMGKTQLAVEFCYRYGRFFPGGVYWLSFANAETVADEIAAVGGEQGMGLYRDAERLTQQDQVARVRRAWQEDTPRLLVFDNCESEELLDAWLPTSGGCRVLLTSRRGVWAEALGVNSHPLQQLRRDESVQLLRQLVARLDEAEAVAIATELGDLPLALHLAGGFLRRYQQITPTAYLQQLRHHGLLRHPSLQGRGISHSPTGHTLHVARTFALNFDQLDPSDETDAMAQRLLACAIAFAPGEPIPQRLLLACVRAESDDLLALLLPTEGLTRLLALGMLRRVDAESVQVHRLLSDYATAELGVLAAEGQTAVEMSLLQRLLPQIKVAWGLANLPLAPTQLRHIVAKARQRADRCSVQLLLLWGCHQRDKGMFATAERYLQAAWRLQEQIEDIHRPEAADTLQYLGSLYVRMGQYQRAQSYFERYLALLQQTPSVSPMRLAWGEDQLGLAFMSQGLFAEAQEHLEKSMALYEAHLAPDQPPSDYFLINLSVLHFWKGNYATAQQLFERCLRAIENEVGAEHQETAVVLNYMADILLYLGETEKALALHEQTLKIRQKTVGAKHLQTAFSLTSLGHLLLEMGNLTEAQRYLEEALAIREKVQGKYHRLTAVCLNLLAQLHLQKGNLATAKQQIERSLAIQARVLGSEHPETADSLITLGEWYLLAKKDAEKAKALFEQARTTLEKRVNTAHIANQRVQRHLAKEELLLAAG